MPSRTPSAAHRGMGVHGLRTGMNHPSGACSALRPMLISAVKCRARRDRPGACSSPVTRRHTGALPSRFRTVSSRWRMKAAVSSPCPERLSAPMHRTTPPAGTANGVRLVVEELSHNGREGALSGVLPSPPSPLRSPDRCGAEKSTAIQWACAVLHNPTDPAFSAAPSERSGRPALSKMPASAETIPRRRAGASGGGAPKAAPRAGERRVHAYRRALCGTEK